MAGDERRINRERVIRILRFEDINLEFFSKNECGILQDVKL